MMEKYRYLEFDQSTVVACFSRAEKKMDTEDRRNIKDCQKALHRHRIRNLGEIGSKEIVGKLAVFFALNDYPKE